MQQIAFPCSSNQLSANEWTNTAEIIVKKKIGKNDPLNKKDIKIKNNYLPIRKIRDKISEFLRNKNIILPLNPRLEISHHYGIEKFNKIGITMVTVINKNYCKKLIIMLPGQKHPAQFHKIKEESFFILDGIVNIKINGKKKTLKPGELLTIKNKQVHEFWTKTGAVIEELSTTSTKEDSFYIDKNIHLNKKRKSFIYL